MNDQPDSPRRSWPRFGISGMLMLMLLASVMAAAGYYGVQGWRTRSREFFLAFILVTLTSPVVLLIVVSLIRAAFDHLKRNR